MSAASPVQAQVRRKVAAAPNFTRPRGEDAIRVNLADIPVARPQVEVATFEPTLLSRLFDLFGPRR